MKTLRYVVILLMLLLVPITSRAQSSPVLQANESGITIQVFPNAVGATPPLINLSTATAVKLRAQGPNGSIVNFPMTVSGDGTYATYITQAGDFQLAGFYQIELIAVYGSSQTLRSSIQTIQVGQIIPGIP